MLKFYADYEKNISYFPLTLHEHDEKRGIAPIKMHINI